ncbi:MAG: hypothetical protein IK066_05370 [Kiritimatiellae bacterium]|nr:hypothetical protein [Kiritimatiellia bacterium]
MMKKFTVQTDGFAFGCKVVEGNAFGVRAFQCSRTSIPKDLSKGVYLLLDDRHSLCYVGEAGKGSGGIGARIANHDNTKELWWTHAVFFVGAFEDDEDLRYWIERRLFDLAKPHFGVVSRVAEWKRPVPDDGEEILGKILLLCALLGLPFSSPALSAEVPPLLPRDEPAPRKNHEVPHGNWTGLGALAQAIAKERNGGKGKNGIEQVLKNFWVPSTGKWRKAGPKMRALLESINVEFDAEGFVKSCAKVPCPLPSLKKGEKTPLPT